jgi:hypothetical protein
MIIEGEETGSKNNYQKLRPKNNFETFDVWSKAKFGLWSNARYDFELIAELTRQIKSTSFCLSLLHTVNKYIKNAPKSIFFDGTVKCLKYLLKNKYLHLFDLPSSTREELCLVELLKKYSERIDIIDIFASIEHPIIRAILLEYPNLLDHFLRDELGVSEINRALLKNGINNYETFIKKVDDGSSAIEISLDKNSLEPMKCKLIYIGLRLNSGKLLLASDDTETIRQFSSLTDKSIEEEAYTKGIFNSMYVVFYGSDEWNKDGTPHLSGCQILQLNLQLISIPDNHMYLIYEQLLKEETERIAKKYFPTEFNDKGFVASLAIKIALLIIVFRSENFLPNDETPEVTWFSSGTMLDGLNYAVKESTSEKGKKLSLKKWFLDYYTNELEKRIAFIRLQVDNNIGIFQIRPGVNRVFYLPVFESFKFFCADSPNNFLPDIIRLFQNRQIGSEIKDDILVNFVINIQKIIGQNGATQNQPTSGEKEFKDLFILLISEIFKNLTKKIIRSLKIERTVKKYYEESYGDNDWRESDLLSDANLGMIEMILNFDLSKNNSFIGYIASGLRFKIISGSRIKKNDELTISERELAEDFWENIPEISDFIEKINDQQNIAQIRTFIDSLPEKQREAVKKFAENNEKLSDSERKNKNRGLDKIKEMMSSP